MFEFSYNFYSRLLIDRFIESDNYFYSIRSYLEKIIGYYNVRTDLCDGEYCGNTIVCAMHTPITILGNKKVGVAIKDISIIAGKLAASLGCMDYHSYKYDDSNIVKYKEYHFYKNCPLKMKIDLGIVLFSILCNVNYATIFVNSYFIEEIPQKLKFAYL
ncbi:hypothetical protein [Eubacterium aggregans]|uniref:hypothetical protein n=1 Tax=Eubacterium aggregans TaxID=81409 RepID=UPI003F3BA965